MHGIREIKATRNWTGKERRNQTGDWAREISDYKNLLLSGLSMEEIKNVAGVTEKEIEKAKDNK